MSHIPSHPAIAVAVERMSEHGGDFTPVGALIRDEVVGVVLDSEEARAVLIIENHDGVWVPPSVTVGGSRPTEPRHPRTLDYEPLQRRNRKRVGTLDGDGNRSEYGWFAVTGLAAEDAEAISIVVDDHEHREPIGDDGLAFGLARVHRDQDPQVYVHTTDGRRINVRI